MALINPIIIAIKIESSSSHPYLTELDEISWNMKKPTGGKNRPKITGKTVADYIIEDRR
jgi:hypothetical protein